MIFELLVYTGSLCNLLVCELILKSNLFSFFFSMFFRKNGSFKSFMGMHFSSRSVPYQWVLLLLVMHCQLSITHKRKGFHTRTTSGKSRCIRKFHFLWNFFKWTPLHQKCISIPLSIPSLDSASSPKNIFKPKIGGIMMMHEARKSLGSYFINPRLP